MDSWSGLKSRWAAEARGESVASDRPRRSLDPVPSQPGQQAYGPTSGQVRGFVADTGREPSPLAASEGLDRLEKLVEKWASPSPPSQSSPARSSGAGPTLESLFKASQANKKGLNPTSTASILSELWQSEAPAWPGRQNSAPSILPPPHPETSKAPHLVAQAGGSQAAALVSFINQRSNFDSKLPIVLTPNLSGFTHKGAATAQQQRPSVEPSFHDFLQLGAGLRTGVSHLQDERPAKGWSLWRSQTIATPLLVKSTPQPFGSGEIPPPLLIDSPLTSPTEPHTPTENTFTEERKFEARSRGTPEEAQGSERPPTDSWHAGFGERPQDMTAARIWIASSPGQSRGGTPRGAASDPGAKRTREEMNVVANAKKRGRLTVQEEEPRFDRGNQEGSASVQEEELGENSLSRGPPHQPRAPHVESSEDIRRQLADAHRQLSESQLLIASMEKERVQWQHEEEKSDVGYSEDDVRALMDGVGLRLDRTEYALRSALEEIDQIRIWVGRPRRGVSPGKRTGPKDAC